MVVSVDLWRLYLRFVHQINSGTNGKVPPEKREEVASAYEYALNQVGLDRESGSIWLDYVEFVNSEE
ncbi:mRNA 3'-end-processing protein rna14, partial [Spiromyces aspiralis]